LQRLSLILLILLLAAAIRISNVNSRPVWTDEGWSTWAASDHDISAVLDKVVSDRHPPLYFLSLSAWWTVAGGSRLALRFLSIAGGLLTIAATYRIGADWLGRRAALYAAAFVAVLDVAVYYSQEIRHYGWLTLGVTLMTLFFLRYLNRPRLVVLGGYVLSTAFMLYVQYIGALALAVHGLIGLFLWRGNTRSNLMLIGAWIVASILYIPWLGAFFQQLGILTHGILGFPSTLEGLLTAGQTLFGGQLALMVGLYIFGSWRILDQRQENESLPRLALLISGAGAFVLMFMLNTRVSVLEARTLVYLVPLLMLICGYGLSVLNPRTQYIFTVLMILVSLATTDFVQPRLDYHLAANAVAEDYTPGDLIVIESGWDDNAFRYELMLALGDSATPQIVRTLPWVDTRHIVYPIVPQIEDRLRQNRRVWVVNWLQPSQVIPYLDSENDGLIRVLRRETFVGKQYADRYDAPVVQEVLFERPNADGKLKTYGENLLLRDALFPAELKQGNRLHVDLWWSALSPLPQDYSVGVYILAENGEVLAQHDGAPGDSPTTQWISGALTFDRHTIQIPENLPPGKYRIGVQVYWYGDRVPLPVDEGDSIIGEITIIPQY
jgi:hypothetical protein